MRTVSDTAKKMTALMSKLSFKSLKPGAAGAPESVDVSELIEEIVAPMRSDGPARMQVTVGGIPPVTAVREQIHQVLLNLILNARQALVGEGDVTITAQENAGLAIILVEDTGRGISSAMLETLFRPSQSSRPGGLGVGLYQCKQVVEAHRGMIQVTSIVGKGTQVRVELPLIGHSALRDNDVATSYSIASS